MTLNKTWFNIDNKLYYMDKGIEAEVKPVVYNVKFDGMRRCFYLDQFSDSFFLPKKIYDVDSDFIARCKKSWENSPKNMGILLTGIKGTGKTITGKILAQETKLPIILITEYMEGVENFISELNFDCVVFCDEFEKVWEEEVQQHLLTLMDGVKTTKSRMLFLLTSNKRFVSDFLIDRPSRIRYIKEYDTMSPDLLISIIKEEMKNAEFINDAIHAFSAVRYLTIDVVLQVINECNIHNEPVSNFIDVFNVTKRDMNVLSNIINMETEQQITTIVVKKADQYNVGDYIYDESRDVTMGRIREVMSKKHGIYSVDFAIPIETKTGNTVDYDTAVSHCIKNDHHTGLHAVEDSPIGKETIALNNTYGARYRNHPTTKNKKYKWTHKEMVIKLDRPDVKQQSILNLQEISI